MGTDRHRNDARGSPRAPAAGSEPAPGRERVCSAWGKGRCPHARGAPANYQERPGQRQETEQSASANQRLKCLGVNYQGMELPSVEVKAVEGTRCRCGPGPFRDRWLTERCFFNSREGIFSLGTRYKCIIHRGGKIWCNTFLSARQDSLKYPNNLKFPWKPFQ